MTVMLITFNGTHQVGQHLGDTIAYLKVAWMYAQNYPCEKYILTLSPIHDLNFIWQKFIDTYNVEVVYDNFDPGNWDQRFQAWDYWRHTREIEGRKFDIYKEMYRRVDGGMRQGILCGQEAGLGRKNIFEYFYFGQEEAKAPCLDGDTFSDRLAYHPFLPRERAVLIAPYAKCQGNSTFTFQFWDKVVRTLVGNGVKVTVNHSGDFCNDLIGPYYRKIFPNMEDLLVECCRHRLVACGNTGVGWMAAATGTPLLAMQPVDSHFQDYRYEWCGVESLVDFLEKPEPDYCVGRIMEEIEKGIVLTTGCYDILHAGHIKHLEESKSLGCKLIVALNSDASVKELKGNDRPINKQDDRAAVLKALRCVDEVRIFDGPNALPLIKELRPAFVTNGSDHKLEEIVGKEFVETYGGEAVVTGTPRRQTSTKIIKQMKEIEVHRICERGIPYSVNPIGKLRQLADELAKTKDIPGDIAELGCYRGGCSLVMRDLAPNKTLHIFDTFSGTPEDDPLCHHKKGEWSVSLEEVKGILGDRPVFHPGIFPQTAAELNGVEFAFVFVDSDTYQSVRDAIEYFWPRLSPGGKLHFDDYAWEPCSGVKKAIDEKFSEEEREINEQAYSCTITKR